MGDLIGWQRIGIVLSVAWVIGQAVVYLVVNTTRGSFIG
jgi:hypothetical protein